MVECLPFVRSQVLSLNTGRKEEKERWREKEGKENRKERHRTHRGKHRKKALAWWGHRIHRIKPCSSEPKQLPELSRG